MTRIVKGFLDLLTVKFLTGFGQRPQHLLGTVGPGVVLCWGCSGWSYLAARGSSRGCWSVGMAPLRPARSPTCSSTAATPDGGIYSVGLLLLGGQLMSIGFLGELIIAYHGHDDQTYSVAERTGRARPHAKTRPPDKPSSRPTHDRMTDVPTPPTTRTPRSAAAST